METREELIQKIEYSEMALEQMQVYRKKIMAIDDDTRIYEQLVMDVTKSKKPLDWETDGFIEKSIKMSRKVGLFLVIWVLICYLLRWLFSVELTEYSNQVLCTMIGIVVCIKVIKRILYLTVEKPKLIRDYRKEIDQLQEQSLTAEKEMKQYAATEEWQTAVSYIPKDYFYMTALKKMKFFLENGHADTMKETLRLYDEYLHRQKMEYEATRAADHAEEASEYARIQTEQTESLKFWTEMNALTNMAIYNKLG